MELQTTKTGHIQFGGVTLCIGWNRASRPVPVRYSPLCVFLNSNREPIPSRRSSSSTLTGRRRPPIFHLVQPLPLRLPASLLTFLPGPVAAAHAQRLAWAEEHRVEPEGEMRAAIRRQTGKRRRRLAPSMGVRGGMPSGARERGAGLRRPPQGC